MFFWNSLAFLVIQQMLAIWSLVPLPFLNPAWTSGISRFTYRWSLAWRILITTLLTCEMSTMVQWFEHSLVLEKTLENLLDCKEIQPIDPKGNQSWIFIGRSDFEAETPILWSPDGKNWLIGKEPFAGKDWRREKGATKDEMVGSPHWLNRCKFE